jgi:hypothetical protein
LIRREDRIMESHIGELQVTGLPGDNYALTNKVYISPTLMNSLAPGQELLYFNIKNFIVSVAPDKKIKDGKIGLGNLHRQMMRISKIDKLYPKSTISFFKLNIFSIMRQMFIY